MLTISHRLRTGCAVLLITFIGLYLPFLHTGVRADSSIGGHWEQTPPYGGTVHSLAIDPSDSAKIYAGTSGGLFRSTDHGLNWKTANEGLPLEGFMCLVIDPAEPSKLFTGTSGSGLFSSTDSGSTWTTASSGLTDDTSVNCLGIDPLHPSILYAGTDDGVFRSTDGGANWTSSSSALVGTKISCLAIDPVATSTLYAGGGGGVFAASDGGATWTKASSGLTNQTVQSLAIDPVTTSTLYAGTANGVFRSTNSGTTWTLASSGLQDRDIGCLAVDLVTPSTLYAGTANGVCRSTNSGSSWTRPTNELSDADVLTVVIDSTAPSTLYAGTYCRGLFKSSDHAGTWAWSHEGLYVSYVAALATHPSLPYTFLVGAFSGLYTSTDGGGSWEVLGAPFVRDIVFDPATPSTAYVATWIYGVGRTTSSLHSWTFSMSLDSMLSSCLAIDPITPSTLYVGTLDKGIFRSTDRGDTWARWSTGLTSNRVWDLAIDPVTGSTLYAGTDDGLFRSTDRGQSWKVVSTQAGSGAVAIDPKTPTTVYAAGSLGVYRSTDGGDTWKLCSGTGMILKPTAVAVDPVTTSTVYAGAAGAMFCLTDAGDTWVAMSTTGLPSSTVNSISIVSGTPATLFACTDRGLFRWFAASPPSVPDGFIVLTTTTTVTLTWPASTAGTSPVAGYAVYRSTTAGSSGATPVATVGAEVTRWTDTTCNQGVAYYYAVAAFDNQETPLFSEKSSEVTATLVPPSPPSAPRNLLATPSVTGVRLSWSASTAGTAPLAGYAVFRSTAPESLGDIPIATVDLDKTSWTDTTCRQEVMYYYAVAAFDNHFSEKSSEVSARLLPPPPIVLTLTLQLGSTKMLVSGSDGTSDTVTLDAAPVLGAGNRTLVPVRAVAEAMGGTVGWDSVTRTASVTVGSNTLELTLGKNTALFNGMATQIDTDPKVLPLIINGRTMLPLRFVVESLGAGVSYDQATKTITITYTKT